MAFFKKILSSIGIGSAKVDTVLEDDEFYPGDEIDAVIKIKGGSTEQTIEGLYLTVNSTYGSVMMVPADEDEEEEGEMTEEEVTRTARLAKIHVADTFTISPGEEKEIPISFDLPYYTPLTMGKTRVWVATGLDIERAIDPKDRDEIDVVPGPLVSAFFGALAELGFELMEADCEEVERRSSDDLPFFQEFEFKAFSGPFKGRLAELEVVFFVEAASVEAYVDVDRKHKGMGSLIELLLTGEAGEKSSRAKLTYGEDDIDGLKDRLEEIIDGMC
jgi:sporulation-control protein